MPLRSRRRRRKRPPRRPGETIQGQPWQQLRLGVQTAQSPALWAVDNRLKLQDSSKEAGDERSQRKKHHSPTPGQPALPAAMRLAPPSAIWVNESKPRRTPPLRREHVHHLREHGNVPSLAFG